MELLAEALVIDYLETKRKAEARLKSERRKEASHGQGSSDVNGLAAGLWACE